MVSADGIYPDIMILLEGCDKPGEVDRNLLKKDNNKNKTLLLRERETDRERCLEKVVATTLFLLEDPLCSQ